ncbi:hypothetical protein SVAN01_00932 [Stagonosporopsis vannaccii]|nr:hypothetical protein SVAN01_00932 [Stagonosporopsis vannaccii]
MSTTTAPSYLDDGISFARRLPHPPHHPHPDPSSISAYTGSYIDDGLDLLPPVNGHGFGIVDRRFYHHRRRRHRKGDGQSVDEDGGVWSKDIARAVTGDVQRSLQRLRGLGDIGVRRPTDGEAEKPEGESERKRRRERKKRGVIAVPKPVKWGVFVIKAEDGRVIVVDEKGEWDSGPVGRAGGEGAEGEGEEQETAGAKRWVRAASTLSADTPPFPTASVHMKATAATSGMHKSTRRGRCEGGKRTSGDPIPSHQGSPPTPILESEYSFDPHDTVPSTPLASPTDFFMTGGLSAWPSRTASLERTDPIVPHAITWDTTAAGPSVSGYSYAKTTATSKARNEVTKNWTSTTSSPSGNEPASTPHYRRSQTVQVRPYSKAESTRRRRSSASVFEVKNKPSGLQGAYRPPDVVEVVYDETPPGEVSYPWSETGWDGGDAVSAGSRKSIREQNEGDAWDTVSIKVDRRRYRERAATDAGWDASARASDWGGSRSRRSDAGGHAGSVEASVHGWTTSAPSVRSQAQSQSHRWAEEWDGYERPKSGSE